MEITDFIWMENWDFFPFNWHIKMERWMHGWKQDAGTDNLNNLLSSLLHITHKPTALAQVHLKHMVKLRGLTWQRSQWCQSNPPLKPWWHHCTVECVKAAYGIYVCKGSPATVHQGCPHQVIYIKLGLKTNSGNTTAIAVFLIILWLHVQFTKNNLPFMQLTQTTLTN